MNQLGVKPRSPHPHRRDAVLTHVHTLSSAEQAAPPSLPPAQADRPPARSSPGLLRALQQI